VILAEALRSGVCALPFVPSLTNVFLAAGVKGVRLPAVARCSICPRGEVACTVVRGEPLFTRGRGVGALGRLLGRPPGKFSFGGPVVSFPSGDASFAPELLLGSRTGTGKGGGSVAGSTHTKFVSKTISQCR